MIIVSQEQMDVDYVTVSVCRREGLSSRRQLIEAAPETGSTD